MSTPETEQTHDERLIAQRYRLDAVLGRGAMGIVWAAYDQLLQRKVAVKEVLPPTGMPEGEASELRERTLREARANAILSHPNVITVYDVVLSDGEPFVVMELFPSTSLASIVRHRGPLGQEQTIAAADAVAAALEAAHRAGITHRDVKPGNVLVSEDGQIKLSDFGIARNVEEHTLTGTGLMLGTPAFISPEVASGDPARPTADLWGLGATLFALTEGRPPYDADGDPLATVTEVVHGDIPVPHNAGAVAPVIAGLMVKNPADRLSLAEVRRMLRPLLPGRAAPLFDLAELPTLSQQALTKDTGTPTPAGPPSETTFPGSPQLAADPGPLPFARTEPVPVRRRWPARLALTVASVLLFAAAGGGGFVATRIAFGETPLPQRPTAEVPVPDTPPEPLVPHNEQANVGPSDGGRFAISYPNDWTEFREQRGAGGSKPILPASSVLRWVSANGDRELSVTRLVNFYPSLEIKDYLSHLTRNPDVEMEEHDRSSLPSNGGPEPQLDMLYRATEYPMSRTNSATGQEEDTRSIYLRMIPHNHELWVVRLTVDNEQELAGRSDFDAIIRTFTIA